MRYWQMQGVGDTEMMVLYLDYDTCTFVEFSDSDMSSPSLSLAFVPLAVCNKASDLGLHCTM